MNSTLIFDFFKIFFTFIMILDPLGNIPMFMSLTNGYDRKIQIKTLRRAMLTAGLVLLIFAVGGRFILVFFGITPGAFYVAGGIIFFKIAIEMINNKPKSRKVPDMSANLEDARMIAIFPLAFPLIAGPGMITTIMVYTATPDFSLITFIYVIAAIVLSLVIGYLVMASSTYLMRILGTTGMFVMEKIIGLILAGLSVQLVYDGLEKLGIIAGIGVSV